MFYIRSTKLGLRVSSEKGKDSKKPRITYTHTQIIQTLTLTLSSETYLRANCQWAGTGRACADLAISLAGPRARPVRSGPVALSSRVALRIGERA